MDSSKSQLHGSDATAATFECLFLAMIMFPIVQRRACEGINHIIDNDSLPSFEGRESMPYTDSILKEARRVDSRCTNGINP